MPQIHIVAAFTGISERTRRDIGMFSDRSVADQLARNAQAAADAIIARGVGVHDRGQNPYDLLMEIEDYKIEYLVRSYEILDAVPTDPADSSAPPQPLSDEFDFTSTLGFWNSIAVEHKIGARPQVVRKGEREPEPVLLRRVGYKNLVFSLYLEGELVFNRWDEETENFGTVAFRLSDLTGSELQYALETGHLQDSASGYMPRFMWTCEALEGRFRESLDVVPSSPVESARQLARLFEGWLVRRQHSRKHRPEFDALLTRFGL